MDKKIDDKILSLLSDRESYNEWDIARGLYPWDEKGQRSKHGAWIRVIVQALWRLWNRGMVNYFWVSHGEGIAGTRMWFRCGE